jgi:CheY-like chemotaxis protein
MMTLTPPTPAPRVSLKKQRIFVVEDNIENRFILRFTLASTGAVLEFDNWGRDTLRKLHAFAPVHLILLDLMLPMGVSGYSVFEQIRRDPDFAASPIVAVSAAEPSQAIPQCRKLGFAGFIGKPINCDIFPDQLTQILNNEPVWA